jgi:hypothetical protein
VFLTRSGPLQANSAVLSDAWFQLGVKVEGPPRRNDLAAVGAILAQIVRRREVAAWPIEDAPEWKALGRAGKAWLAYVNFLMDPQPATGELTIAEARKRLRAIPKDANPARTALIIGVAAAVLFGGGLFAFARFGNPIYMPDNIRRLAENVGNPRTVSEVPASWALLCRAWDSWLADVQGNAPRLLRNEKLWSGPDDPLRKALADFAQNAVSLKPGAVVPEAAEEKRLGVLADAPPPAVLTELKRRSVQDDVTAAYQQVVRLATQLENWPRWDEMRDLQARLEARGFTRAVGALQPKLPPPRGPGYKLDIPRTLKLFNDLSLDENGTLLLASRWNTITRLRTEMEGTLGDRVQNAMPRLILERLRDTGSIGNFAESLGEPLDELSHRRQRYLDQQVVHDRFLKESALLKETAEVTPADFPRWEEELALFSKVLPGDDPRADQALDGSANQLQTRAVDLEADAPEGEANNPATLSRATFDTELAARRTELQALRAKPIVRIDLPEIKKETEQMADRLAVLEQRVTYTLTLLNPQTWLDKVRLAFGQFNETKRRWAAWQQAAVPASVTADSLRGAANRQKFRDLRAQERQVKEFINGLEGAEGIGALAVPDLGAFTPETADALRQLEAARREQAAAAAAAAVQWRNGLPQVAWAAAGPTVRQPIEAHRQWLAELPAFAADLDRLGALLAGGFGWTEGTEGVKEIAERLAPRAGLDALGGKPGESVAEARLLGQLVASSDRAALVAAAQSGKLSRMLTAWRRLGTLPGWPANAADLDIDGGVVESLRQIVPATVKDETRRASLLDELGNETRVRWNRAARNSASNIEQMTAVFERMAKYNISEGDLGDEARYNLSLWQLKRSDWSEVEIPPLRQRRDDFARKVRSIAGAMAQPSVKEFVDALTGIELVVNPNRARTPSPRTAGWKEELTDAGLGLTATWKSGGKELKLDFTVIAPEGDLPPFYLARREIAVGEFLDLMSARPKEAEQVVAALPQWAVHAGAMSKPFDQPLTWRPNPDTGRFELNQESWFNYSYFSPPVKNLYDDTALRAGNGVLDQAFTEKPTRRSPLQEIPPLAAKVFVEQMLGARLPTLQEWTAVMKMFGSASAGNFRGPAFQRLFNYLQTYRAEGGITMAWRPTAGAFQAMVAPPGGGRKIPLADDGQAAAATGATRLWPAPVDEGPTTATGNFVNLTGNVWIYLQGPGDQFYVAGGSVLSSPALDPTLPQKVEARGEVGAKSTTDGFSDVGIRPAFDAPPGFKERYKFLELVRKQGFLTW